jgi:hypothetical protein
VVEGLPFGEFWFEPSIASGEYDPLEAFQLIIEPCLSGNFGAALRSCDLEDKGRRQGEEDGLEEPLSGEH